MTFWLMKYKDPLGNYTEMPYVEQMPDAEQEDFSEGSQFLHDVIWNKPLGPLILLL